MPSPASRRDPVFDILKGIGISEVLAHHLLAASMRKFAAPGSAEWWTYAVLNRFLHFAVPTFLFASSLLLARSMAGKERPNWARYFARRGQRTLWPYVLWSAIYLLFRVYLARFEEDQRTVSIALPLLGATTVPRVFGDPGEVAEWLAWGRAYFHLYFMSVLLQFCALFPLFFLATRHVRASFGTVFAAALLAQAAIHLAQHRWGFLFGPGSTILWYLVPVLAGTFAGLRWRDWETNWERTRRWITAATALSLAVYLPLSLVALAGQRVYSPAYNAAATAFTSGMAILLLGFSRRLAGGRAGSLLARIGDLSLPLFLIHPMAMYLAGGPRLMVFYNSLPLSPIWYSAIVLAATWFVTSLLTRGATGNLFFGRRWERRAERAEAALRPASS
jgi:peptidoglycan/LPS O-acetylase OafA/YrhL